MTRLPKKGDMMRRYERVRRPRALGWLAGLAGFVVCGATLAAEVPPGLSPLSFGMPADVPVPALRAPSPYSMDELGNKEWAAAGFLDVTAPPFSADPTGRQDSTRAIQAAVDFAREHQLVCFFPPGRYRVSDTIVCEQYRKLKPDGRSRYGDRNFPCVLVGSRTGPRPQIVLAAESPGFDDPTHRKYVIHFWAPGGGREAPIDRRQPNISMNQMLIGIDVVIERGNPGAVGIRHRAAQGSGVQDCTIDARGAFCGLEGGAGSGGSHANVTIIGGRIGLDLRETQPAPTVTGFTLIDQEEAAVVVSSRQSAVLVGTTIVKHTPGPAVATFRPWGAHNGQLCMIDSTIEYRDTIAPTAIHAEAGLYLRNVYVRGAKNLVVQPERPAVTPPGDPEAATQQWCCIREYAGGVSQDTLARDWNGKRYTYPSVIYIDGRRVDRPFVAEVTMGVEPPDDLQSRHLWAKDFPHWQQPNVVDVRKPPYNAAGDGTTDDWAAIQKAIDEARIVFLPKGTYAIGHTLHLRKDTVLIGTHRCFSWLVPKAIEGGDFNDPSKPQPVVDTPDDASASTTIAFFGIGTLDDSQAAYCLRWRVGRNSIFRDVNIRFDYRAPAQGLAYPEDRSRLFDLPLVLVTGHGGGKWYDFHQESSRGHGPNYRHLLVDGTSEPLHFYQCNPEHARSEANFEIRNAQNVFLYGVKGEYYRPIVMITDSRKVGLFGYGGVAAAEPGHALFVIRRSDDYVLANLVDSVRFPRGEPDTFFAGDGVDPELWFMVEETPSDGTTIRLPPLERPVLYRRGKL
ncbi:MAG: hypothetical protein D6741_01170 [Planctomycetota bacterium]|nr:MAG: hypothetical protein D6741_01170 [Planctomycetota bacterium]